MLQRGPGPTVRDLHLGEAGSRQPVKRGLSLARLYGGQHTAACRGKCQWGSSAAASRRLTSTILQAVPSDDASGPAGAQPRRMARSSTQGSSRGRPQELAYGGRGSRSTSHSSNSKDDPVYLSPPQSNTGRVQDGNRADHLSGRRSRGDERGPGTTTKQPRSRSAPAATDDSGLRRPPARQLLPSGPDAKHVFQLARDQRPLGEVAQAVLDYKQRVEEGGCQPPTYAADISSMMESLSKAAKSERGGTFTQHSRQRDSRQQAACAMAAGWLCSQALAVVQASHADHCCIDNNSNNPRLPIQDLCALAYRLPDFIQTLPSGASIIPLARSIAELAAVYIEQGDAPPIVRSWCDLLYGLTKAGLVVNMEVNASPVAVKQHSPRLQQLMDEGAQRLPALLASQGAVAQDVSLTLLAYAYAGYTGDLGPVTQALASNMEGCLQGAYAQNVSNTLWALGKLCEMEHQKLAPADAKQQPSTQPGAYSQELFSYALGELHSNLEMAKPQGVSNAVYGCALAGHVEGVPQLLDSVCQQPQVMARAKPQEWSNIVWAAATLHEAAASQGHTEGLARRLRSCGQLLMGTLVEEPQVMARAKPQNWSNIVWAAAKLGCVEQGSVLLQQLARQPQVMTQAIPQHWSNTLWAAATLHQIAVDTTTNTGVIDMLRKGGHPLLQACASSPTALKGANSQDWSNTLWAAAVLHWYDQHLFSQGAAALAAMPPAKVKPQAVSNALYACALCAHWDGNVQQLLGRVNEYDLAAFAPQALANALYAWSVLSCAVAASGAEQQRTQALSTAAAALLQEAASRPVSSFLKEGLWQLYAAHLYAQHLGIPGLPAGTVLEAARAAGWSDGTHSISASQEEVARALQQLGYTVQVEMKSPDGLMSVDVGVTALPGGSPCSIAVEFDGPYHYVTEYSGSGSVRERLDGPTRLRNTFLHARFPDGLVCIPWKEWVAVTKDDQQEEYIMRAMAKVLESKVPSHGPQLAGLGSSSGGRKRAGAPHVNNQRRQPTASSSKRRPQVPSQPPQAPSSNEQGHYTGASTQGTRRTIRRSLRSPRDQDDSTAGPPSVTSTPEGGTRAPRSGPSTPDTPSTSPRKLRRRVSKDAAPPPDWTTDWQE